MSTVESEVVAGLVVALVLAISVRIGVGVLRRISSVTHVVTIEPPEGMQPSDGYRYSMLKIREGADQLREASRLINKPIPFEAGPNPGQLVSKLTYHKKLGVQFKCFLDMPHGEPDLAILEEAIKGSGWTRPSLDQQVPGRVWFLIAALPTCTSVDGYENNHLVYAP